MLAALPSKDGTPTEEDIRRSIDEVTEELKQATIAKRVAAILCRPVYPSLEGIVDDLEGSSVSTGIGKELQRMIGQLQKTMSKTESVYQEQATEVARIWDSSKYDIVPGDLLLDKVCQKYGVRFKKDRDGARLAALMNTDEINSEIETLIRGIGG